MIPLILLGAVVVVLAGGTLAFGAVYPWAFTPMAIAAGVVGLAGIATGRRDRPPLVWVSASLALIAVAVSLQLVPMRASLLGRVSPGTDRFLRQYDLSYLTAVTPDPRGEQPASEPRRPISIAPADTRVGLGLFAALALSLVGCARLISRTSARPVMEAIFWLGLGLAVLGIVQELAIGGPKMRVYGVWTPSQGGSPFGPFINRNHFAGWMLMALPLAVARLIDRLMQATERGHRGLHDLLALTRSREGGRVLSAAVGVVIMGLSLVLTRSRSGVAALAMGIALFGVILSRRASGRHSTAPVMIALAALLGLMLAGAGLDTSFGRFREGDSKDTGVKSVGTAGGRLGIWRDTLDMARRSPWTGQGLNTYGTATIVFQSGTRTLHNREAHNDYLQLAAEGGLLVCVPALIALGVIAWHIRERFREAPDSGTTYWARVGAVVGLASIAAQAIFEFSLQMPANALLCTLLVALALHRSPNLRLQRDGRA